MDAGLFQKQQAAQNPAGFLFLEGLQALESFYQQTSQQLKSLLLLLLLFSKQRLENSKCLGSVGLWRLSPSMTIPSFCKTRLFLLKGIFIDDHLDLMAVMGLILPPPPRGPIGVGVVVTHAVVLPPAVLVRFLTRRFIGEYASNASKCFQVWTQMQKWVARLQTSVSSDAGRLRRLNFGSKSHRLA